MEHPSFDRGSALSIFKSDRLEDIAALVAALVIAVGVLLVIGHG
ncbi:hypothetical protein SIID45300_00062 [Candidatus Magnetaquicoccaceae bacterium FCR-1]|uniref:Uncharacterized protein n=1 Tax=Candidatus Magnetaquiglobus chichijimensis TaxID=3141448 RepID=A0ABQ0C4G1_9PROT